ncbi:MAG TPA: FGGY family carbohydrate kinase, partial [Chryseosolibacter sp.]|nr:FGGY family carbohydrate kinase [Chryseosolibacter sp.]
MSELLLGLDIGSSSVKASVVDVATGRPVASAQSPAEEMAMLALQPGWAEQDPDLWWQHVRNSISQCVKKVNAARIRAIGISYQMHGLVVVGKDHKPLRQSIIWCDSRAVSIGETALRAFGEQFCLGHFLNSPGNFTASKLRWVKENEPSTFEKIHKAMLPGDYIALRLTGEIVTTDTGLSEGIFWDYTTKSVSAELLDFYQIPLEILPPRKPVFSVQGTVTPAAAGELGLPQGIPVSYRAGDQPNNAFSLNVLKRGETAATAGTSGVIYSVTDKNAYDSQSRVNTFVHVNNTATSVSNGVLLCINGTGITNSWLRKNVRAGGAAYEYAQMNDLAAGVPVGSHGLVILPFGNGAERVLGNRTINASISGLDFNRHTQAHLFSAAQEGIVFALRYGFDVLRAMEVPSSVIKAG